MTNQCRQCKTPFHISENDLLFLERMHSPLPNYCPDCRVMRRLVHRNERTLYRRTCDKTGASIVAIYPENTPWPVYQADEWWGDAWDAKDYGQDYDPSRPFFDQWIELRNKVPRIALLRINSINCEFTNNSEDAKNCYLVFAAQQNEDCMYGRLMYRNKNCVDGAFVQDSELCYECIDVRKCFRTLFSERCEASSDLLFCFDCRDCQNCILSTNLRHKKYVIENQQYSKEEYEKKYAEIMATYDSIQKAKDRYLELRGSATVKYASLVKCKNAVGDYLYNCHDVYRGFDAEDCKNCAYVADAEGCIDCMDMNNTYYKPELNYDIMGSLQCYNVKASTYIMYSSNSEYCDSIHNCTDCFGCVGLKKASYCILNTQYSKEAYEVLKAQIIKDMSAQGVYGDFLPPHTSPFGYNETLTKDFYPLGKEAAIAAGYPWQDATTGIFGKETIQVSDMPQTIQEVPDSIIDEVLVDEVTGQNFKITAPELQFYRQMHVPLPRRSFETRHQDRMARRNPRELYQRTTADGVEVETTYAPDRKEKILSEAGYQQAVE